jgi:hypothetical protein
VEGEDDRFVPREELVEVLVAQAVRVLAPRLERHQVHDVDDADLQLGKARSEEVDGRERFQGVVQIGMPDLGGNLDILASFRPNEKLLLDLVDEPEEVKRLYNYGRAVGIAFQIKDDILDRSEDPERQERVNLVVLHYLDEATKRERVGDLLGNEKSGTLEMSGLYEKALEFALQKSRQHVEKAKQELKGLRDPSKRRLLEDFADYSLERRV